VNWTATEAMESEHFDLNARPALVRCLSCGQERQADIFEGRSYPECEYCGSLEFEEIA
jgi:Zn finger protein HypA/HybF involved in hydrogenase expression